MSTYAVTDSQLTAIADEIRLKRDTSEEYTVDEMPLAISLIEGGGGGSEMPWVLDQTIEVSGDVTQILCDLNTSSNEIMIVSDGSITSSGSKFFYPNKQAHYLSAGGTANNALYYLHVVLFEKFWLAQNCINSTNGSNMLYHTIRKNELNISTMSSFKLTINASSGTKLLVYRK